MILVITNDDDQSSNKIIEWLDFFNVDYCRVNEGTNQATINSIVIERDGNISNRIVPNHKFQKNKINVTFFRRGLIWCGFFLNQDFGEYHTRICEHLKNESIDLREFFYGNLDLSQINSPFNYRVNKLMALKIAANSGLLIPKTIVTNNKAELLNSFPDQALICKPITDNLVIDFGSFSSSHSPKRLPKEAISELPDNFGYSLFQELITVKWEIRAFVFGDLIRSIAVVNVKGSSTSKNLFRLSGSLKRVIPIELPTKISACIHRFMKSISLFTGSIDLLYSGDDREFYFLEVNPVGQFDYVSYFGNYNLEKLIAEKLIEINEKKKENRFKPSCLL